MDTYFPALPKNFPSDAKCVNKTDHVFHFVVAPVLHQENMVYIILESLFIHMQAHI